MSLNGCIQCEDGHWIIPKQAGPPDELLLRIERARDETSGKVQPCAGGDPRPKTVKPIARKSIARKAIAHAPGTGPAFGAVAAVGETDAEMARRLALEEGSLDEQATAWDTRPFAVSRLHSHRVTS